MKLNPGFLLFIFFLSNLIFTSCSQESKNNSLKKIAKMTEADFSDKKQAEEKINQLFESYKASFLDDTLGFEKRIDLFSQNYLKKMESIINHAKYSEKKTVENLLLSEQLMIMNFRETFSMSQLETLSTKELLSILNKDAMAIGISEMELINLLFYDSNQASGAFKTVFSVSPVLFDREGNDWKIDIIGDPLHQKMKEEALAKQQNQTLAVYRKNMHEILRTKEESWVPLNNR